MGSSPSSHSIGETTVHLDRHDPYLRLHHVTIFVRDLDRSLPFYLDQLGFSLVIDYRFGEHGRFVLVSPPDGSALLGLVAPHPASEEYKHIGQSGQAVFVTEDVSAKFHAWRERGVHFRHPPEPATWGGTVTSFEDMDGNSFVLVGFDEVTREVEAQRRAVAEKLESERVPRRSWKLQNECRQDCFLKRPRPSKRSITRACASRLGRSAGIITISLIWVDNGLGW